jgi:DNA-binding response OmpR family regulator
MTDMERNSSKKGHRRLSASLRHELRTPLNAILGYSEMLLETATEEGLEDVVLDLEKIRTAGRQLLALLSEASDVPAASQPDQDVGTLDARLDFAFRTPLNAILGYTEMLLEDAHAGEQEALIPDLQRIRTAVQRFLAIMDGIGTRTVARDAQPGAATPSSTNQDAKATTQPSVQADTGGESAPWGHLLVVDDSETNRDILSRYLEQQGYAFAMAKNGCQALEMIGTGSFDLVLLDIMMPEMDGYQVLQSLKSDEAWRDIPVIMISALDEIGSVVRCIEMGAEDYLPKPFDPVLLRARIGASLEKKRLRDQEIEYLQSVARVTAAAAAVEAGRYELESLADVAQRTDGLGQLARVFQRMAWEVFEREQRLKQQVQELCIELSEARKASQVAEITETEYFQRLQAEAQDLRDILAGTRD